MSRELVPLLEFAADDLRGWDMDIYGRQTEKLALGGDERRLARRCRLEVSALLSGERQDGRVFRCDRSMGWGYFV